jgi:hypothetical protein
MSLGRGVDIYDCELKYIYLQISFCSFDHEKEMQREHFIIITFQTANFLC